ncbi:MAG: hypothetical protein CME02_07180 [Geminicoccus sp.]|nr:hypothetical protein [Geminicoccus sp.]
MTRPRRGLLLATALLSCAVLTACGRKGDPRPVTTLAAATAATVSTPTPLLNPFPRTEMTLS